MDGAGATAAQPARSRVLGQPGHLKASAYRAATIFAVAGALSRFTFRYVETRWQIAAFWVAAAVFQFVVRPIRGRTGSAMALALDGMFAAVAIVAVKVAIEGHL